jgi:hypothetical protein
VRRELYKGRTQSWASSRMFSEYLLGSSKEGISKEHGVGCHNFFGKLNMRLASHVFGTTLGNE